MTGPSTTGVDDQLRPAPPEVEAVNAETSAILKARDELVGSSPVQVVQDAANEIDLWLTRWGRHADPEEVEIARVLLGAVRLAHSTAGSMATRLAPQKAARDTAAAAELANDEAEQLNTGEAA